MTKTKRKKIMNIYEKMKNLLQEGDNPPVEDMVFFAYCLGKLSAAREYQKKCEDDINYFTTIINIYTGEGDSNG